MRAQSSPPSTTPDAAAASLSESRSLPTQEATALVHQIRARAFVLGLLLIPPVLYWLVVNEMVRATGYVTKMSLFYDTLCVLFVLTVLNNGLARWRPRLAF